ncbi:hypothetical protein [Kutzneria sp. NPDC052558]|uniref:hypothetical protein n=1 Tax=Kutzneria sp. NPDC052558 TaxID=3364121 RepID=UPI0037CA584E
MGRSGPTRWRLLIAAGVVLAAAAVVAPVRWSVSAHATSSTGSTYVPAAAPARVLDTRAAGQTRLPVDGTLTLQVPGVPVGATAVVLNVTAVAPTAGGFLTVYPHGTSRPSTSNVDFSPNQTTANLVMVPAANGSVDIFSAHSSTDVVVDFEGYYEPATGSSDTFTPLQTPGRILDTRSGLGIPGAKGPLGPNSQLVLQVSSPSAGIPDNAAAVVLNLTATGPTDASYLTAYATGTTRPATSNVNFGPGQSVANLTVVPVSHGQITIWNNVGTTDVVADIFGYYTQGAGSTFTTVTPMRVLNTLDGTGTNGVAPLGESTVNVPVASVLGAPPNITAVLLHVAVVNPTADSFLTIYPSGPAQPDTSNINFSPGQIISNSAIVPVGSDGKITFWNHHGAVDIVADVSGYFTAPPSS